MRRHVETNGAMCRVPALSSRLASKGSGDAIGTAVATPQPPRVVVVVVTTERGLSPSTRRREDAWCGTWLSSRRDDEKRRQTGRDARPASWSGRGIADRDDETRRQRGRRHAPGKLERARDLGALFVRRGAAARALGDRAPPHRDRARRDVVHEREPERDLACDARGGDGSNGGRGGA